MKLSRRRFLQAGSSSAALSMLSLYPTNAIANMFSNSGSDYDYRAIVGIQLAGGNDGYNMLIPNETNRYQQYQALRGSLAIPHADLAPLAGSSFGLHPALSNLTALWDRGVLLPILNTGSLVERVTSNSLEEASLPAHLYSHNHQQVMNQTYGSPYITKDGFAARSLNILPELLPSEGELSPAFDMAGGQVWTSSFEHASNFIGTDVPSDILKASYKKNLFNKLNSNPNSDNVIFNHYMKVCNSIEGSYEQYNSILNEQISESFPNTSIGKQLEAVFKMILNRSQFPHKAQFFSCVVGGFDTHSNQLTTQATLLGEFSDAVIAFQEALEARGLSEMITTFTHSDFGRTLIPNTTDGTDHGWASHSLVLGGSVRGNQILGEYPDLSESSPYLLSRGRVVPTISTDQIHASLMNWLGVPEQGLNELFPPLTTENMDSIAPQVLPIYGSAPVDPDPGLFPGVDPWDSAMVYVEGDLVSDRDKVWVATTLTQGIKPSNKTSDWLKTIPPSAETWDEYTQYSTGVLVYSGASIWQSIAPGLGDFPRSSPEKWTKLYVVQT